MELQKILKVLGAIFALRAKYWANKSKENYDEMALGMSCAYDDAFDMLAYAINNDWDCLRQFGWSDEAENLIDEIGSSIDLWDLEGLIKNYVD